MTIANVEINQETCDAVASFDGAARVALLAFAEATSTDNEFDVRALVALLTVTQALLMNHVPAEVYTWARAASDRWAREAVEKGASQ